jgi:hypothetical protein
VAIHWGDISNASIPAVSFIITAIMPTRCPQGNEAVRRRFRLPRSKRPDQTEAQFIPKRYCKPFAIGRKKPMFQLNRIVL